MDSIFDPLEGELLGQDPSAGPMDASPSSESIVRLELPKGTWIESNGTVYHLRKPSLFKTIEN